MTCKSKPKPVHYVTADIASSVASAITYTSVTEPVFIF